MRFRGAALVVTALALLFCPVVAAALPKAHARYFYLKRGTFSLTLSTGSAKRIVSGKRAGASSILVVCPTTTPGAVSELQMGFPGANLKLRHGHFSFNVIYTEGRADIVSIAPVFGQISHERATVTVTGSIHNSKLIVGTVSVVAPTCNLPKSGYRATPAKFG
jgi:hypothetical protein